MLTGGKTRALHPEDPMTDSFARDRTRLLVSASTGPIHKQNHAGEMKGQGTFLAPTTIRILIVKTWRQDNTVRQEADNSVEYIALQPVRGFQANDYFLRHGVSRRFMHAI